MTPSPEPCEVWLVRFVFLDDADLSKVRPAVCLSYDGIAMRAVMAKVTSHTPREGAPGELSLADWEQAGLMKPSCVRCSQIVSIPDVAIYRRLGRLSENDQASFLATLASIGAIY